jgi:hypothetical protein
MTFQFLCPQGHLLQGEEADMGMQCQCPQCGMAFIIPTVERPAHTASNDLTAMPSEIEPEHPAEIEASDMVAGLADEVPADVGPVGGLASEIDLGPSDVGVGGLNAAAAAEGLLHIPCPNGHELETPLDMIGQRVLCPHCRAEFTLRRERSIEYLHEQEILDRRRAQFWFQAAIAAAGVVGLALLIMIALMIFS